MRILPNSPSDELDDYERLLDVPDHDLYVWVTGEADIPEDYRTALLDRIVRFHQRRRPLMAQSSGRTPARPASR